MRIRKIVYLIALVSILFTPQLSFADDVSEIVELKSMIHKLDQKIADLEKRNELAQQKIQEENKEKPVIISNQDKYNSGFGIQSADGKNKIQFGGLIQLDNRQYIDKGQGNQNGFDVRRIRPIIQGTLDGIYDFKFQPEYGENKVYGKYSSGGPSGGNSGISDAYFNARFKPWVQVQIGKFAPDVGLERLESSNFNKFIELSTISNNFLPSRDVGVSFHGSLFDQKLYYAFGVYQGVVDGGDSITSQSANGGRDYSARLFLTPFKNRESTFNELGFGLALTHGDFSGDSQVSGNSGLPAYRTPGQQSVFFNYAPGVIVNGSRNRVSPQAYFYSGPLGVIAEYALVSQDVSNGSLNETFKNDAWEITASWLLTGENSTHNSPVNPTSPVTSNLDGWGAWEFVARYEQTDIDDKVATWRIDTPQSIAAKSAKTWGAGVNWYLTKNVKFALNYELTHFDSFSGQLTQKPNEEFLDSRLQLAF